MSVVQLFYGTDHIIEVPSLALAKNTNDYGKGFYCTLLTEMAKEWACKNNTDGFVNEYTDYEYLYEYMAGKLTDKKVNGEKLARLAERGYVGKDGEINVTVFKGTESAFRDALPSPEADLLDEAASLALESALVEAKRYPPQMQDLIVSYNSVPVDTVCALMALDILYANGTFKPLTEREKVAANLIMFSDVLPG